MKIVEWHRPMAKRALAVPLAIGAVLMTVGGLCVLLSLPRATKFPMLAVLGGACVITAPISVIYTLIRRVGIDACLVLRSDAIVMQREREEILVPWDEIKNVRCVADAIEVEKRDGSTMRIAEPFAKPTEIAARMEELRRKAEFGLI
jgi:hypothetical protein